MEETSAPAARGPSYDVAELRARMIVCFTAQELRDLAAQLGVEVSAGAAAQDVARAIVRHFERDASMSALVDALRAARPLVEWPEPLPDAGAIFAPAPALAGPGTFSGAGAPTDAHDRVTATGAEPAASPPEPAPPTAGAPQGPAFSAAEEPDGPIIQDPHVPQALPWITSPDGVVRPGGAPSEEKPKARGLDPRLLVVVAGLTVIAALFAYGAGRASQSHAAAASSASPVASAAGPANPGGPAARAASVLVRGLEDVARTCEIRASDRPGAEVLRAAFDRCGPPPVQQQPVVAIPPPEPIAPTAKAEPDAPRRPESPSPDRPLPPGPSDGACMKGCGSEQKSCTSACGAEPTEASKYADYQACLSKCLRTASKCRLACQ